MLINSIHDLAVAVRVRRRDLGLNQADLAREAGVSRKWVYEFEGGKPTAELGLVLRVLEALGLSIDLATDDDRADVATDAGGVDLDRHLAEYGER
jgi:HTH-type transcriptional regulator / antitoxin HipB